MSSAINSASKALRRSGRARVMRRISPSRSTRRLATGPDRMLRACCTVRSPPRSRRFATAGTRSTRRPSARTSTSSRTRGLDGILALGTTGEGILLSPQERRRAADLFLEASGGRLQVAVHCGAQTTADTVALAEHAAAEGADAVAVISPPYFALDDRALLDAPRGGREGVRADALLPVRVRRAGRLLDPRRGDRRAARAGAEPARPEGLEHAVGALRAVPGRGTRRLRRARAADPAGARARRGRSRLRARRPATRRSSSSSCASRRPSAPPRAEALRKALEAMPVPRGREGDARAARAAGARGRARAAARARPPTSGQPCRGRDPRRRSRRGGAPASRTTWRSLGARDVVLCDRGEVAGGATSKAMGGVRQQFSTGDEVRLARESVSFFQELGEPLFEQVGYLFLATTEEGLAVVEERYEHQRVARGRGRARRPVDRAGAARRRRARGRLRARGRRRRPACGDARARAARCRARRRGARAHAGRGAAPRGGRRRDRVRAVVARARSRARDRAADPAALPPAARDGAAPGPPRAPADDDRGRVRLPLPPPLRRPAGARDDRRGAALGLRGDGRRVGVRRPARAARTPLPAGRRDDDRPRLGRASTT